MQAIDNDNPKLNAFFSKNNLYESVSKSTYIPQLYYVLSNIDSLLEESIKIEEHLENKADENNKGTHEYLSALLFEENKIMLIKVTLKESKHDNNNLYSLNNLMIIKKEDDGYPQIFELNQTLETSHPPLAINIAQLVKIVNSPDILRYIPNELLSYAQINIKTKALERYNIKKKIQIEKKEGQNEIKQ